MGLTSSTNPGTLVRTKYNGKWYETLLGGGNFSQESISHDLRGLGRGSDVGGPWKLTETLSTYKLIDQTKAPNNGNLYVSLVSPPGVKEEGIRSNAAIKGDGATAIARSWPISPDFSAATFIGELREGLPSMVGANTWKERTALHRGLASEHLNYQFGWAPLLSDIQTFAKSVKESHRILRDFHEGSGRNTRKGYRFPGVSEKLALRRNAYIAGAHGSSGTAMASWSVSFERKTWFKGCFTYYIPVGGSALQNITRFESNANALLGTRITPEVLWNLAPWSWAADWFGNFGDVIANISQVGRDGSLLRYGYIMEDRRSSTRAVSDQTPNWTTGISTTSRKDLKRFPANPYSLFGALQPLTGKQIGIASALGITLGTKGKG